MLLGAPDQGNEQSVVAVPVVTHLKPALAPNGKFGGGCSCRRCILLYGHLRGRVMMSVVGAETRRRNRAVLHPRRAEGACLHSSASHYAVLQPSSQISTHPRVLAVQVESIPRLAVVQRQVLLTERLEMGRGGAAMHAGMGSGCAAAWHGAAAQLIQCPSSGAPDRS